MLEMHLGATGTGMRCTKDWRTLPSTAVRKPEVPKS